MKKHLTDSITTPAKDLKVGDIAGKARLTGIFVNEDGTVDVKWSTSPRVQHYPANKVVDVRKEVKAGDIVKFNPRTDGYSSSAEDLAARWEVLAAPANAPLYLRKVGGPASATCGTFAQSVTVVTEGN